MLEARGFSDLVMLGNYHLDECGSSTCTCANPEESWKRRTRTHATGPVDEASSFKGKC